MKKILAILTTLIMCITLSSCVMTAQAQTEDDLYYDNIDVNVIVTNGRPYFNTNGYILYWVYRDLYYYPYYYNDRLYLHRYHRPLPPHRMNRYIPIHRNTFTPKVQRYNHRNAHITRPNTNMHWHVTNGRGNNQPMRQSTTRNSSRRGFGGTHRH